MIELEDRAPDGPPVEPANTGDKRRARQPCPECDKTVGNLPSHLAQVHGIRGANAGKSPKQDRAPTPRGGKLPSLKVQLTATYQIMGQVWAIKDPICGGALIQQAPTLAAAWDDAAQSNATLHRWLNSMMSSGSLMLVAAAHVPLAAVVISHHGPASRMAEPDPWQNDEGPPPPFEDGPPPWFPPGVSAEEAYGPYAPGSADNARD